MRNIAAIEEPAVIERIPTHLGFVGAAAAADTGAARRSLSGGLILERGLDLARADGWARLARVAACESRKIARCDR